MEMASEMHGSNQTLDKTCSDVEKILQNDLYRKPFQQFLEQQFCAENINFYMAVEEYRSIPDSDLERRAKVASQIFEKHFSHNSVEPVNVDNCTSKSIKDAVMSHNFTSQLFDVAQYQYDCWPRYLRAGGTAPTFGDGSNKISGSWVASTPTLQYRGKDKRKSLIWHALKPRCSHWKKAWSDGIGSLVQNCNYDSSVVQFSESQHSSRLSFAEDNLTRNALFFEFDAKLRFGILSKYGSLRRRGSTISGKQRSIFIEMTRIHSSVSPQTTSSSTFTKICAKFCTLVLNDARCVERIALQDPKESVGKWTAMIAAQRGMDPRATEVVDAQSGATIDPARQAVDALNNRCVRLLPILYFAAEIVMPSCSNKMGVTNSRLVLMRARHGLSLSTVLKPVLAKYLIDFNSCVIVLPNTSDVISGQATVGSVGQRFVVVMTQQQYQERQHSPKHEVSKEVHSMQFSTPEINFPFYQHGDVAFVELPADYDLRTGKINAVRCYSNTKTDHTSSLLKFVRKASQAVTNREPSDFAGPSFLHHHQGALQQQYFVGHIHSHSMTSNYTNKSRRKSLGEFQRTVSAALTDIPYCGEDTDMENQWLPETPRSGISGNQTSREYSDPKGKIFEIPEFLKKVNTSEVMDEDTKLTLIDSVSPKIPPLYTSTVSSDKDFLPCDRKESLGWQRADYV
ncbi:unnamed protein product [Thelazia callipaeda]|uniref:RGS domain-containing protein n=1 Tax=Thelazia callipaeda TaxID=103827 RepID=A0A158RCR8_THECL|nr:unnamed protein product [Thelazia callipaeda]